MAMHESITAERVIAMVEADAYEGICIECGEDAYGVEPDMRDGQCEACGQLKVYGAEELLFYFA